MRYDSVKCDKKADGGEDDRREPPGLIPGGLFDGSLEFRVAGLEFGVAALDNGGKVFVHSGLHEFGLGGGGGLNGAGQGGGLRVGKSYLFQLFRDG